MSSEIRAQTKILKIHFEFAYFYFYFVLIQLEFKRLLHLYTPVVSSKIIPDSRPSGQSVYPFSDQKGPKPEPQFGAAHTSVCMANIREYPPGHVTPVKD